MKYYDQRYIARIDVPPGTLLAVYCGSLEKTTARVLDLCHSMHMGSLVFPYELSSTARRSLETAARGACS